MKKFLSLFLAAAALLALPTRAADGRAVIAADLTEEQIEAVYADFGLERGSVPELTLTNADERALLAGLVPDEQIGTRSISCVLVTPTEGETTVRAENVDFCTEAMYLAACATAGIEHAAIHVTAPFTVSGTAALAGIYMAYEDMTGQTLGAEEKEAGLLELVTTGKLRDALGSREANTLVTELKLILEETRGMSDEELDKTINDLAGSYKIPLNDTQREMLRSLCRGLEKLDGDKLHDQVEGVKRTLEKAGEFKDKAVSFWDALVNFFKAIGEFVYRLFAIFG
jgi:uncharacterized protein YpuA (DUF1002 family)